MAYILDENGEPLLDENGVGLYDENSENAASSYVTVRDIAIKALGSVPNCNYIQAEFGVRDAIIEFCERTWAMERFFGFDVPLGVVDESHFSRVRIDLTNEIKEMRPLAIQTLAIDQTPYKAVKARLIGALSPSSMLSGLAKFYDMAEEAYLDIFPFSTTKTFNLSMKVAFVPPEGFTQVDTSFYHDHRRAILDGTIAYLFDIPKKSWSNERQAAKYRGRFDGCITTTKIERAIKAGDQNQQAVMYPGGWP